MSRAWLWQICLDSIRNNPLTFNINGNDNIDQSNVGDSAGEFFFFPQVHWVWTRMQQQPFNCSHEIRFNGSKTDTKSSQNNSSMIHQFHFGNGDWSVIWCNKLMLDQVQLLTSLATTCALIDQMETSIYIFTISQASSYLVSKLATTSVLHNKGTAHTKVQTSWWSSTTFVRGVSFINLTSPVGI